MHFLLCNFLSSCVWDRVDSLVSHWFSSKRESDVIRLFSVRRLGWLRPLSPRRPGDLVLLRHQPHDPQQGKQLLLLQADGRGPAAGPPRQPRQERTCVKQCMLGMMGKVSVIHSFHTLKIRLLDFGFSQFFSRISVATILQICSSVYWKKRSARSNRNRIESKIK